jgi:HPt (histidine-containing phosphotransfer) domain-containing protein
MDMEEGLAHIGGNRDLYRRLLVKFRKNYVETPDEIISCIERHEVDEARRLAHSVKGVAGNLGAKALFAAADRVENAIQHDDSSAAPPLIRDFSVELQKVILALQAVQETPDPTSLLGELVPCVRAGKPKKCEPILDQILRMEPAAPWAEEVMRLSAQIKGYRYKEAAATLDGLIERVHTDMPPMKPGTQNGSADDLLAILETLEPHVRARKPKTCEPQLKQLKRLTWPKGLAKEVEGLSALIRKYRFKEALHLLDSLTSRLRR